LGSVCVISNVLTVTGTAGNDSVTITQPAGLVHVESTFFPTSEFALASVQSILVQLGAGDDTLVSFSTLPMVAAGGDGADSLTGGSGRNVLIGGLGADLLTGGEDEDILVDGASTHDNNGVALLAILAEWISNHSFVDRMKNLTNGSGSVQGLNETTEGSYFLVADGNDGEFDFLIGGDGKDWIIRRHK
jgi:Ca2+-binding RTX toxin-like protein